MWHESDGGQETTKGHTLTVDPKRGREQGDDGECDGEGKAGSAPSAADAHASAQSASSNCKSSLSILGGVVNYFNSEWSFAKFR